MEKTHTHEITPEHIYLTLREFLAVAGALVATTLATSACGNRGGNQTAAEGFCNSATTTATSDELGNKLTSCADMVSYNTTTSLPKIKMWHRWRKALKPFYGPLRLAVW